MAFQKFTPPERAKVGQFKFAVRSVKGGPWRLNVTMSHAEYVQRFGSAERLSVFVGVGNDAGKLAFGADPNGAIKPSFLKYAVTFRVGGLEGMPEAEFETVNPGRRMNTEKLLEVVLPDWWTKWEAIKKAREAARR